MTTNYIDQQNLFLGETMESYNTQHESFDAPESIKVTSQTFQPEITDTRIADLQATVTDLMSRVAQLESSCGSCKG